MTITPQEAAELLKFCLPVLAGWLGSEIKNRVKLIRNPEHVADRRIEAIRVRSTLQTLGRELKDNTRATADLAKTVDELKKDFYGLRGEVRAHLSRDGDAS